LIRLLVASCGRDRLMPARLVLRVRDVCYTLFLRNSRKTQCGAKQFLFRLEVRAAPFALLRNSRKTECGAVGS